MRTTSALLLGLLVCIGTARAAPPPHIGSWVLTCSATSICRLRAEKRFVDKDGVTVELDVLSDRTALVPVLALRGLPAQAVMMASAMGTVGAWIQLDGGVRRALECAPNLDGYFCTPRGDAARALAAGLPTARTMTARVEATVTGMKPLPVEQKTLALVDTRQALATLAAAGAEPVPDARVAAASRLLPRTSPSTLAAMADTALKAAGYRDGLGDLPALMSKYRNSNTNPR
ncbi:hypothetical protein [Acidisphaera sp. S103]|uniref:hypothetical protein n=1 Tax=Acidisphaera sp. S103 TaxID=1747223 RepID=UPI00131E0C92|nr:hypothetical protein [Acidisphaera sp. S103]